ncbi:DDE-type integrase/transposase/recombinase [Turicibacter sanguinis]|uniref:DDE-type integrase/transposase/recombinase n=1 Tax=Turicibacter sanguinis TaxID=154288 RepID=UPI00232D05B4|nr:DDE-type integrase/transposase/recombinase [Turicibacter sanguinis]MDB8460345.1 IS3 family transposase [Turicibacter sanguinis]
MSPSQKFKSIHEIITKYSFKNLLSHLCDSCGVSRLGYYRYFSASAKLARQEHQSQEEERVNGILKAFEFKGHKNKGVRQVTMVLHRTLGHQYNHKSVHRIMRKYGLLSSIRRANPYRKMIEDLVHPNRVKRQFKVNNPGNVLLTDITYLQYGKNQTAYLSTILDAATNKVITYQLRDHLKIDLVLEILEYLTFHSNIQLTKQTVIHSDQDSHYTSPRFSEKVKQLKIK